MKAAIRALALAALVIATAAVATPPTVIDVREEPFGASETHFFLARVSTDNLGYYESNRIEIYLIAVDWKTGQEEAFLIDRYVQSMEYSDTGEPLGYAITRDPGVEPANPHQIMTERGGLPWLAIERRPLPPVPIVITPGEEVVEVAYDEQMRFRVARTAIQDQLDRLAAFMAENVAEHPRSTQLTTREFFAMREVPAAHCRPARLLDYWVPGRAELPMLLQLECGLYEEDGATSVVVQLETVPYASSGD